MQKTLAKMAFVAIGFTFAAIVHESAYAEAYEANEVVTLRDAKGDAGTNGPGMELSLAKSDAGVTALSTDKGDAGPKPLSSPPKGDAGQAPPSAKNDAGAL